MKNGEIMKTGIKIAMMSLLTFSLVGCNDFLDTTPHDSISDKVVWNDIHTATLYLNGFYPYIDRYGQGGCKNIRTTNYHTLPSFRNISILSRLLVT